MNLRKPNQTISKLVNQADLNLICHLPTVNFCLIFSEKGIAPADAFSFFRDRFISDVQRIKKGLPSGSPFVLGGDLGLEPRALLRSIESIIDIVE
jgi:hypothetical protein